MGQNFGIADTVPVDNENVLRKEAIMSEERPADPEARGVKPVVPVLSETEIEWNSRIDAGVSEDEIALAMIRRQR